MYILGISAFYHDSAACLLKDGEIVAAAQEERFTRIKNDAGFPRHAIAFCLAHAGISLRDVAYIAFYEKPFLKFERLLETYLAFAPRGIRSFWKAMPLWMKEKLFQKRKLIQQLNEIDADWEYTGENLLFTEHHQAHAASAFFPSPFHEAAILTVDGVGEWTTTSLAKGSGNTIETLQEIRFPHSIGLLYSAFTYYLGFKVNSDEYKVMGLAPYGKPAYVDAIYQHLVDLKPDGSFRLNMDYFDYCTGLTMTNWKFEALFGQPIRKPDAEITPFHQNIARSVQQVTEEMMLRLANHAHQICGVDNLCLAGGVALNCVANGKMLRQTPFRHVWIQPAAGDAGGALGAAYSAWYEYLQNARTVNNPPADRMQQALLGPAFSKETIRQLLVEQGLRFYELPQAGYYRQVAQEIANGKVIGWFQGRMEFGPRALGARSIIGDPRNPAMQSIMNQKIKFRESFRPFAPAVLEEYVSSYFDLAIPSPYMLLVASVAEAHLVPVVDSPMDSMLAQLNQIRSTIPAVTHVDNSARIQTVNQRDNPAFYRLIHAFYQLTGCPLIINTSFNVKDEPIVCTPEDALRCFWKSEMDVLAIENCIVYKHEPPTGVFPG